MTMDHDIEIIPDDRAHRSSSETRHGSDPLCMLQSFRRPNSGYPPLLPPAAGAATGAAIGAAAATAATCSIWSTLNLAPTTGISPSTDTTTTKTKTTTTIDDSRVEDAGGGRRHRTGKPIIPRRGHTKSRFGCFNCKRRRVKCQETRPAECQNCVRAGLICKYPETERSRALEGSAWSSSSSSSSSSSAAAAAAAATTVTATATTTEISRAIAAAQTAKGTGTRTGTKTAAQTATQRPDSFFFLRQLQSTPAPAEEVNLTRDDLKFFHHFLLTGFPPLPLSTEGEKIWRDVAALSHSYDYLMHALLGLGASNLAILSDANYAEEGLAHRVKAIRLLNEALSQPCASTTEGDARFAAIMALAFQASCMPEGMNEFLTMTRGCFVVATSGYNGGDLVMKYEDSMFGRFTAEGFADSVRRLVPSGEGSSMGLDPDLEVLLDEFLVSWRGLAPLCKSALEVRILAGVEGAVRRAKVWGMTEAFAEFATQYTLIFRATTNEFNFLTDPTNHPAQLLAIHFMLIEFMLGRCSLGPAGSRFAYRKKTLISWLDRFVAGLPPEYHSYAEWPVSYVRKLMVD